MQSPRPIQDWIWENWQSLPEVLSPEIWTGWMRRTLPQYWIWTLTLGVASSAPAAATELESPGADLSLDVDLPMPDESGQQDPELPSELAEVLGNEGSSPAPEESDGEDALVYAEDVDPIDTQLDLARAYIDMGDEDGARPVLNEVIAAGDLRQQAEARELLVSID